MGQSSSNLIKQNYFEDIWVLLEDGHMDYLDFNQNMAYNLQQINGFEDPPFMSNNCSVTSSED